MDAVMAYINGVIDREGNDEFTDDPNDSGGPTRWGVTEATARAYGYTGDMRLLPRETAVAIFLDRYWIGPGFHLVNEVSPALAERLLDFGVLAGQPTAASHFQRCLNVLNRGGKDYPDLAVDGRIGRITIGALNALRSRRGAVGLTVVLGMVASMQSAYLVELAERRPKDEEYEYGWQLNRAIGAILVPETVRR